MRSPQRSHRKLPEAWRVTFRYTPRSEPLVLQFETEKAARSYADDQLAWSPSGTIAILTVRRAGTVRFVDVET